MTSVNLSLSDRIKNRKKFINSTLWTSLIALPLMAIYYIFGVIMMLTRTINYAEVSRQSEGKFYHSRLDAVIVTMGFKQIGWLLACLSPSCLHIRDFHISFHRVSWIFI